MVDKKDLQAIANLFHTKPDVKFATQKAKINYGRNKSVVFYPQKTEKATIMGDFQVFHSRILQRNQE